ncbi:hypothetical protein COS83_01425 [archaeon CG07_land_8_20_14_0_80_38_8]|nr:MAG: hypothetical protein COS83_01425 [archaeon CG07_land_8_20_14_0_80_38_8]PIU88174.1 MAG: hypothetical protein COS64_04555 [archaeon CG06_land_8_20_14_3_00_37_11]
MITLKMDIIDVSEKDDIIYLYGVTEKGETAIIKDENYSHYFYVSFDKNADLEALIFQISGLISRKSGTECTVLKVKLKTLKLLGEKKEFLKITVNNSKAVNEISGTLKNVEGIGKTYEKYVNFSKKYLFDKKLTPLRTVKVIGNEMEKLSGIDYHVSAEEIIQLDEEAENYKILCFDIETYNPQGISDANKHPILMISYATSTGEKGVLTWKNSPEKFAKILGNEKEMIEEFLKIVRKEKPAFIATYSGDNFDFPYLKQRGKINKVRIDIGWDGSQVEITGKGLRGASAKIIGTVHIDLYPFIATTMANYLKTDSYTLNDVCYELLGEKKEDFDVNQLAYLWDKNDISTPLIYSLKDAEITLRLAEKVLPLLFELTRIIGVKPGDASRTGFSKLVENYLMKETRNFDEIIPRKPNHDELTARFGETYKGGFVYEPVPGFYENIAVFDFRSLYPSIIVAHNICPTTLNAKGRDVHVSPEIKVNNKMQKFKFAKKPAGFIPILVKGLIERRNNIKTILKQAKKDTPEYNILSARQNAIKILTNATYGYLGFPQARWYSLPCAASITAWGRQYINNVIKRAELAGLKVLYGDSLHYDRRIFVKDRNENITLVKIGEFVDNHLKSSIKGYETLSFKDNKLVFSPIEKVIRHKYNGKLLEIITKHGKTVLTPQHSVYTILDNKLKLVDANLLKKDDKLVSLTNPEVSVKFKENHIFDVLTFDFKEYSNLIRVYEDNLIFKQGVRGKCPYCAKNYILCTHVSSKHKDRKLPISKGLQSNFEWIGGDNSSIGKIPRYWKLDKELAWILGFYCAEGSISEGKKYVVSFGNQNLKYIKRLKYYFEKVLHSEFKIIKNFDKRNQKFIYYFRIQRIPLIPLFKYGFCLGRGSENKTVPWFIYNSEDSIKKEFIKGYLAGDGTKKKDKRYKTHFINFATKSRDLAIGIHFLLKSINHEKNFFNKKIEHVYWKYRNDKPKIAQLRLQGVKSSKNQGNNYCLTEIKSIKKINLKDDYVYDLEVRGTHNFVDAEGLILVHNTDSCFFILPEPNVDNAMEFVKKVNRNLPNMMELQFEGFFKTGIFVSKKSERKGAKKKYALCSENNELLIKGFEVVRRDWAVIAKEMQMKTLQLILMKKDFKSSLNLLHSTINLMKKGKIPVQKFVIKTRLTKKLDAYENVSPHVSAAIKAKNNGALIIPGMLIHYVITKNSGRISDKSFTEEEAVKKKLTPDYEYYINNQLIPSVEEILKAIGFTEEEIMKKEQKTLEGFM